MDVALVLICEPTYNEVLSQEAVVCINSLRMYGGMYKNIPIYIIIPTLKKLTTEFVKFMCWASKKNVIIIKENLIDENTSKLSRGFLNIPFGMKYAHKYISHDLLVYCDCDVIFYREPRFDLIDCSYVYVDKSIDTFKNIIERRSWEQVEEISEKLFNKFIDPYTSYKQVNTWMIVANKNSFIWETWLENIKINLDILMKNKSKILCDQEFLHYRGWGNDYKSLSYPISLIEEITFSQLVQYNPERFKDISILNTAFDYLDKDADIFHFDNINNLQKGKKCKRM
jgi:hypothetical protein